MIFPFYLIYYKETLKRRILKEIQEGRSYFFDLHGSHVSISIFKFHQKREPVICRPFIHMKSNVLSRIFAWSPIDIKKTEERKEHIKIKIYIWRSRQIVQTDCENPLWAPLIINIHRPTNHLAWPYLCEFNQVTSIMLFMGPQAHIYKNSDPLNLREQNSHPWERPPLDQIIKEGWGLQKKGTT